MAKLRGSKLVTCKHGHRNFVLPGVERPCRGFVGKKKCACKIKVKKGGAGSK